MNFSFFLEQAKYTAIYTTIKLKTNYVLEEMVFFFIDKKWLRKKEKAGHLVGYYMTCYTACHDTCFSKWLPNNESWTTTHVCKVCLVVNHPEIALTLEKCLIQGKIIVCFPWIECFFYELCDFSWYLHYRTSLLQK